MMLLQLWDLAPKTLPNAPAVVAAFPVINTGRVYLSIRTGGGYENEGESLVRTDLGTGERKVLASFVVMIQSVTERGDAIVVNLRDGGAGMRSVVVLDRAGRSRLQLRGAYASAFPTKDTFRVTYLTSDGLRPRGAKTFNLPALLKAK